MNRNFPVSGLKELDAYLSALPERMQRQAVRQALTAAAAPIRDEARLRAPKESGQMAKSIKTGSARRNPDGTFSISVRLDPKGNDHAYLGYFFEYGIDPHAITLRRSRGGKAGRNAAAREAAGGKSPKAMHFGGKFASGTIMHPGVRAHPFLIPALDTKADEAVQAFAGKIREFIEGVKTKTGYDVVGGLAEAA